MKLRDNWQSFLKVSRFTLREIVIFQKMIKQGHHKYREYNDKPKILKDFSCLFHIKPQFLTENIVKYKLSEGQGEKLNQLKLSPFKAYYSYTIYDYDGRMLQKNPVGRISSEATNHPLSIAIMSMKIKEKAWFNLRNQNIAHDKTLVIDKQKNDTKKVNQVENGSGCHIQIELQIIQYKNCENIEVKRHICSQNRQKGHKLMQQKRYFDAAIAFKAITGISEKISKKRYSQQEQGQLQHMNTNGKLKYLQCYFKIENRNCLKHLEKVTQKFILFLLKRKSQDYFTHFYYTKWLIYRQKYEQALASARRAYSLRKTESLRILLKQIGSKLRKMPNNQ